MSAVRLFVPQTTEATEPCRLAHAARSHETEWKVARPILWFPSLHQMFQPIGHINKLINLPVRLHNVALFGLFPRSPPPTARGGINPHDDRPHVQVRGAVDGLFVDHTISLVNGRANIPFVGLTQPTSDVLVQTRAGYDQPKL